MTVTRAIRQINRTEIGCQLCEEKPVVFLSKQTDEAIYVKCRRTDRGLTVDKNKRSK